MIPSIISYTAVLKKEKKSDAVMVGNTKIQSEAAFLLKISLLKLTRHTEKRGRRTKLPAESDCPKSRSTGMTKPEAGGSSQTQALIQTTEDAVQAGLVLSSRIFLQSESILSGESS